MMAIVTCGKSKLHHAAPAAELYIGPYFKACYNHAWQTVGTQNVYILSARYGLVHQSQVLEPYDEQITDRHWGEHALDLQARVIMLQLDTHQRILALGSGAYLKVIRDVFPNVDAPIEGMMIGQALHHLLQLDFARNPPATPAHP